ncbi:DUF924 family protein [Kordiimonas aquimaris]|uniref:DUF924 family protein n=1 Tax=Kordiimonas aquimaris TaxID=707591 RepID=UPI0021D3C9AB|nr:DUF924 family protein [Kordiimonas aquimaris]
MTPEDILHFWFEEAGPKAWWQKSDTFDALVKQRFLGIYEAARVGELASWRTRANGRLAEIIILDQFPRNMFRGSGRSFESDAIALVLAQEAVSLGIGESWNADKLQFLYMPYMHSESARVHDDAVKVFSRAGLESNLDFEFKHKRIIDRFGRYPHRNALLGRKSTADELAFLQEPGSSF